ncbi:MAG: SDR family NAD(P)-dependent oxidoreductase [Chloroflexi bacterium]|nr:SDR family NAD(P)-dependent oxidoreductase [Chloroflexota bacterium]
MTRLPLHQETLFETEFSVAALPFLADHRVYEQIVAPAACQLALVLNAAALAFDQAQGLRLENVILPQALVIPEAAARMVQTVLSPLTTPGHEPGHAFKLISFDPQHTAGALATHATGDVVAAVAYAPEVVDLSALLQRCDHGIDITAFYRTVAPFQLGPAFRWLVEVRQGKVGARSEGLAQLVAPATVRDVTAYLLHPGLLDACFQVAGMIGQLEAPQATLLPFAVGALHCYQPIQGKRWWCHASQTTKHQWNIRLLDEQGITLVAIEAFEMRAATPAALQRKELWRDWLYQVTWQPSPADHLPMGTLNEPPVAAAWLIFADSEGVGAALATYLRQRGHTAILVYAHTHYQPLAAQTSHIRPDCAEDYQQLLSALPAVEHIVHLWSLDLPDLQAATDLVNVTKPSYGSVLHLVQALLQQQIEPVGLWLVTRDAQAVTPSDAVTGVAQAGVWGIGKVIDLEHPELNCRCLDLAPSTRPEAQARHLGAEITAPTTQKKRETQVALRADARYVARLTRDQTAQGLPMPAGPSRLEITERGTLDNLELRPMTRRAPGQGEVEIQVQAGGLNFRDLLSALGLYPGDPGSLGLECVGIVVAVGADVTKFAVGDAVLALAAGSFAHYVTVHITAVIHKPAALSPVEAATIPGVFLTAYYGLHQLAQMKSGDRVLIHAAAGGVGMAAVQLAQQLGAEVFATASPSKWATLRQLGVTHLYHSRTLAFAEQIMVDTNGAGVNIVLNSLTGPGFIEATLATLAPHGKLVEMSKRDVWSTEQVATVRADVRYTRFDLNEVAHQQPALLATMFQTIAELLTANKLKPLPATVFSIREAGAAFAHMQQAKQIGKIVLTIPSVDASTLQAAATYLITGGLGGLGLAVAQWLVEQGARHLLLVGRSRPKPAVQAQLDAWAALGVTVTIAQTDVTNRQAMQALVAQMDARQPLRGVIHSVGLLDDGALLQQNWDRFAKVLAPKLQGAWHLHALTKELPLDFFVLFSSASSLLGNRGQANYAAANAFLDAFVHYRWAQGLPALTINWGAWSEIGVAAALEQENRQQMAAQGMGFISPHQALQTFAYLLRQHKPQVGVTPIDWSTFQTEGTVANPFYANLRQASAIQAVPVASPPGHLRQQLAAAAGETRNQLLLAYLRTAIAKLVGRRAPEQIDPRQGLLEIGLDSLMAIELRNQLARALEQRLPSTVVFDYPTVEKLQHFLLQLLFAPADEDAPKVQLASTTSHPLQPAMTTEIAALSVEALIAQVTEDFEALQAKWPTES